MTKGLPGRATALAVAMLVCAGAAYALVPATRIGVFINRPNSIEVGRELGVKYLRYILRLTGPTQRRVAKIREAEAAGFKVNIQFNNVGPGDGETTVRSVPVTDDAAFKAALSADLDATRPDLVTIQNEEDGRDFWSGTTDDYLRELRDAVAVAHAKGYRISNGGLTSTGVKLAYWHHLWVSGQSQAADRFARETLTPDVEHGRVIIGDLPDTANPRRPILAQNDLLRSKLARVEALIDGYPRTGVDYINFHWYESGADDMRQVATWLAATTGLPVICNEMGQLSTRADQVRELLDAAGSLHMPYVFWFAIDGHGPARGLTDADGALRANGAAFRDYMATHPSP